MFVGVISDANLGTMDTMRPDKEYMLSWKLAVYYWLQAKAIENHNSLFIWHCLIPIKFRKNEVWFQINNCLFIFIIFFVNIMAV